MRRTLLTLVGLVLSSCLAGVVFATDVDGPNDCTRSNRDYGDAPEGTLTLAYPGVSGKFPFLALAARGPKPHVATTTGCGQGFAVRRKRQTEKMTSHWPETRGFSLCGEVPDLHLTLDAARGELSAVG